MTAAKRKPVKPANVKRKPVTDAKRKPVTLDKVTYEIAHHRIHGKAGTRQTHETIVKEHKRFTVRKEPVKDVSALYAIWDKKRDQWLFPETNLPLSAKTYPTRAAAWRYLKTQTTESKEYRLWEIERALDGAA